MIAEEETSILRSAQEKAAIEGGKKGGVAGGEKSASEAEPMV